RRSDRACRVAGAARGGQGAALGAAGRLRGVRQRPALPDVPGGHAHERRGARRLRLFERAGRALWPVHRGAGRRAGVAAAAPARLRLRAPARRRRAGRGLVPRVAGRAARAMTAARLGAAPRAWAMLALVALIGLNLRPFLTGPGTVLAGIEADTGLGHLGAS